MTTTTTKPCLGKIWQTADNFSEAVRWLGDYLLRGAEAVEIKPRGRVVNGCIDDPLVDVIITTAKTRDGDVNPVLGYQIGADEWMLEDELIPVGNGTNVFVHYADDTIRFGHVTGRRTTEMASQNGGIQTMHEYHVVFSNQDDGRWIRESDVSINVDPIAKAVVAAST